MNSEAFYYDYGDIETDEDVDRRFYEVSTIKELKTKLKTDHNKLKKIYRQVQKELMR